MSIALSMCLLSLAFSSQSAVPPGMSPHQGKSRVFSQSGLWSVQVTPASSGSRCSYKILSRDAQRVDLTLDAILEHLTVSNAGAVAGHCYAKDASGLYQRVVAFSEAGVFLDHRYECSRAEYPDGQPNPSIIGFVFQESLSRLVVRVADADPNRAIEEWWVYDQATGELVRKQRPKELAQLPVSARILGVAALPNTSLVLVQWFVTRATPGGESKDALFVLSDQEFVPMWKLPLEGDYDALAETSVVRWRKLWTAGSIVAVDANRFAIRSEKTNTVRAFAISKAYDKWSVDELERSDWKPR